MEKRPLISVIMSVYNAENYLRDAIDSILNQTFSDFEFIIIEDCSTDKSLHILEEYEKKDSRIILIKKDNNKGSQGFIENLNLALKRAKGKYIARMDADDISDLDRLEIQVKYLNENPTIFIVGAYLQMINKNGEELFIKTAPITDKCIKQRMYNEISLYHPVIMFRNSAIRYREKMHGCEDYDFYFQLILKNKKLGNIAKPLLKYRILDSSISRSNEIFLRRLFVELARKYFKEYKKRGVDSYDLLDVEELARLLDPSFKNKLSDLKIACYTAIKYKKREEINIVLNKLKLFYPKESLLKYKISLYIPLSILTKYSRLINNF